MRDEVTALGFDLFGTCVDWRNGVAREAGPFLARLGRADVDPHGFADAWRARYQPSMEVVRSGRRPFTRLSILNRESLETVLRGYGIDPKAAAPGELDMLTASWERLDPWPDVVAGLTRLRTSYIIVPLSNADFAMSLRLAKRAGLPWDAIMGAELTQSYKRASRAYLGTAEMLGLPASRLALVAAHNDDLASARAVGLATAFVPRPTERGPGQQQDLAPEDEWDVVATDFCDLADRLGC